MSLAESGVTAKVYAAYYGRWRRVTDAYMDVYAGTAKAPNTGRVSECTAQLLAAGLLEVQKQKERWPLYRASMQWLYEEFSAKNAALSEADKAALAKVLLPPEDAYRKAEVPWFGLTPAEIAGKRPFSPTPQKIRDFLHASVAYALFLLGNPTAALPKQSVESALERIKKNMGMPSAGFGRGDSQKPMPAVSSAAPLQADAGLAQGQYAHPFTAARAPASTPLYKLVRMPCGERAAAGFLGTSRNPRARNGF